jgi:hypothetical protein
MHRKTGRTSPLCIRLLHFMQRRPKEHVNNNSIFGFKPAHRNKKKTAAVCRYQHQQVATKIAF